MAHLLNRGRIFEKAVMAEKPLTLVTYLMGESCQISSCHGQARAQGDPPQRIHVDTPVPEPTPSFADACNMMWCTEDFSLEAAVRWSCRGLTSAARIRFPATQPAKWRLRSMRPKAPCSFTAETCGTARELAPFPVFGSG